MTGDLISLDDDNNSPTISPTTFIGNKMAANHPKSRTVSRDSFSDLTSLMKAKKPYVPIPPPAPRPLPLSYVPNGMLFAARNTSNGSILSPFAKPFRAPESVAAFLQRQELDSPISFFPPAGPVNENRRADIARLDSLLADADAVYSSSDNASTPSPPALLIPGLASPIQMAPARFGPTDPPTPTESIQTSRTEYRSGQDPVVRVTKQVWDNMGKSLDAVKKQKQELEERLAVLERETEALRNVDHDVGAQLGKLRYQNEANKGQKANMGRDLAQKEMEIKKQQLDIDELSRKLEEAECKNKELSSVSAELDYFRGVKASMDTKHERAFQDLAATKDRELQATKTAIERLERTIEQLTRERDAAARAQVNAGDHQSRAQNLIDTLTSREKIITGLRLELVGEQLRVTHLEDKVEILKESSRKEDIDDLKAKLREKTSMCDKYRGQVKVLELHLKASQERVMKVANSGEYLQGAAHLVRPDKKSRLPKTVYSCSECYANNLECDSNTVCRSCTERNTACARWRCSLKQKLGECNNAPCRFPHDSQGWLVLQAERPQW